MSGDFTDLCSCGEKKLRISKKCIKCIKNKSNPNYCACGKRKFKGSSKCIDCFKGSRQGNTTRCKNCKNHAKKDSDLCGPCLKVRGGICGKKDCSNRISVAKGHRYCGLHNGTPKSRNQNIQSNNPKTRIKCRVCKKTLQPRSVGERAVRGTAGAGMGTVIGGLIGSLAGPLGTLIGAGLGGLAGAGDGSQIENLCENCCRFCENKKSQCICNKIIGLCRSCGCNVTRSNSNNGFCFTCSNSWFGDDL